MRITLMLQSQKNGPFSATAEVVDRGVSADGEPELAIGALRVGFQADLIAEEQQDDWLEENAEAVSMRLACEYLRRQGRELPEGFEVIERGRFH